MFRKKFLNNPSFKTFLIIIQTMLYMSGKKNTLNISRWSESTYTNLHNDCNHKTNYKIYVQ